MSTLRSRPLCRPAPLAPSFKCSPAARSGVAHGRKQPAEPGHPALKKGLAPNLISSARGRNVVAVTLGPRRPIWPDRGGHSSTCDHQIFVMSCCRLPAPRSNAGHGSSGSRRTRRESARFATFRRHQGTNAEVSCKQRAECEISCERLGHPSSRGKPSLADHRRKAASSRDQRVGVAARLVSETHP